MDELPLVHLLDREGGAVPPPSGSGAGHLFSAVLLSISWGVTSVPILILAGYLLVVALLLLWCVALAPRAPVRSTVVWTLLSIVSLAGTWSQMLAFLSWSWRTYGALRAGNGDPLWALPACEDTGAQCRLSRLPVQVAQLHAWLRDTRLFEQAWLEVVATPGSWWWSAEICLFTVGVWPLFMHRLQARRGLQAGRLWVYMLTGQLVAISVANNLLLRAAAAAAPVPAVGPTQSKRSLFLGKAWWLTCCAVPLGMAVVYAHPVELGPILAMHIGPMLLSLPLSLWGNARPDDGQAKRRAPVTYILLGLTSLLVRFQATRAASASTTVGLWDSLWETLWSHPARASIGLDHVGILCSTPLWIGWETQNLHLLLAAGVSSLVLGPSATLAFYLAFQP